MATIYNQVKLATTENVTLATAISPGVTTIDGVIVNANDRILVKAQTNTVQNGIYVIGSGGAWARSADFAAASSQEPGGLVFVTQGDMFADTGWVLTTDGIITVGTTEVEFKLATINQKLSSDYVPSGIVLRTRKGYPLTNIELDNNFKFLASNLLLKLNTADFTASNITTRINTLTSTQANLNAYLLRDRAPATTATANTIALRDSSGNLVANTFLGNLTGTATNAASAINATNAINVTGVVGIANGGTGSTTAASARTALGAVNIAGDTLTGKLILRTSSSTSASLNIPTGSAPSSPAAGDVWSDGTNLKFSLVGVTKSVAPLESPAFSGTVTVPTLSSDSNSTAAASTAFVQSIRNILNAAIDIKSPIASPAFTGNPRAPTVSTSNISDSIANTQFVKDYWDLRISQYNTWGTSKKFVQSTDPGVAASNGDFWFKI